MIIEFAGLPGSGKSTVEKILINSLKQKGYFVSDRHDMREEPSLGLSIMKIPDKSFFKKINTGLQSLSLTGKTIYAHPEYLSELLGRRTHLIKSVARLYEDWEIIERYCSHKNHIDVLNLSEGLFHHLVALNVWRSFWFPSRGFHIPKGIYVDKPVSEAFVLIKTEVEKEEAIKRLTTRGLPKGWPTGVDVGSIVAKFECYDALLCDSYISGLYEVFHVDGSQDLDLLVNNLEKLSADLLNIPGEL